MAASMPQSPFHQPVEYSNGFPRSSSSLSALPTLSQQKPESKSNSNKPDRTTGFAHGSLVSASVTVVPDPPAKKVFLFGGFDFWSDDVYNELYRLNLETFVWDNMIYTKGNPPSKRNDHSATLYQGDKLIIFGGSDEDDTPLNEIIVLNLTTLTWSRPEVRGHIPEGRSKHAATIWNDKLYICGGNVHRDGTRTSDTMHILDLTTWEWQPAVQFVERYSHISFVHDDRLIIYGGFTGDMDRAHNITFIDLNTFHSTQLNVQSEHAPPLPGQHFAHLCGDYLVVLVTSPVRTADEELNSGLWCLDLRSIQWSTYALYGRLDGYEWHYFCAARDDSVVYLMGANSIDAESYLSIVYTLDLAEYGIIAIPPSNIANEYARLLDSPLGHELSDFSIYSNDTSAPPIRAHRTILLARWPHFTSILQSGMSEATTQTLTIPEPPRVVRTFLDYIYTDTLLTQDYRIISDLLVLANMYVLPRLASLCVARLFRSIHVETVSTIYDRANQTGTMGLRNHCLKFMFIHFGEVAKTAGFRELSKEALLDFYDMTPTDAVIFAPERKQRSSIQTEGSADEDMDPLSDGTETY